jgi:hypothetical protein
MEPERPQEWLQQFDGSNLKRTPYRAAVLASTDGEGWPHLAYLSAGEILARAGGLSFALWPKSRTSANILRDGRAVLHAAWQNAVWEARLALTPRAGPDEAGLAIFDGAIVETRRHVAPYADVQDMILFRLHDPDATLGRWEAQLERLRQA